MRIRTQELQIYMPPKAGVGQRLNMYHFKNFENLQVCVSDRGIKIPPNEVFPPNPIETSTCKFSNFEVMQIHSASKR